MTRFKSSAFAQYLATAAAVIGLGQVAQAEDTRWSGYVDAGYSISGVSGADALSVRDGALYFSNKSGGTSFMFDLPFSGTNGSSDFVLGKNKVQAYLRHDYLGFNWRVGQFDGIFGLERNDTVDLFFSGQGALYATQPGVLTAIEAGYGLSGGLGATVYVGGAHDQGGLDSGDHPEVGGKLTLDGKLKVGVGGHYRKVSDTTNAMYLNATAETSMGDLNLGVEGTYTKAGSADAAFGGSAMATLPLFGHYKAGVRAQYLSKFTDDKQMQVTVGAHRVVDKSLTVKADYTLDRVTATAGADATTDHSGVISAVYGF